MQTLLASLRITAATMLVCVVGYVAIIRGTAQLLVPESANGSLLTDAAGTTVGSRLIAQSFERPSYFWPRPSACGYNAAGAAGSNKSPTSDDLTQRASTTVGRFGASADRPLPADLAAASGGGLDPHITLEAVRYQVTRVAAARTVSEKSVNDIIDRLAFSPGGPFTPDRLINVLELNLALDAELPSNSIDYRTPSAASAQ
ncbi:MAG: potassium-transporting ATPase subunit C [Phycisphaerales bacterium]|nr:potassium-transporting ATPase subunit C [Phycisphaerales bacterium]